MPALGQDFEHGASDLEPSLEWLPAVCVDPERDGLADVVALAELGAQQLDGVVLVEELGLEIESRGLSEIGMGRPGETVDAAVAAAAVGIDRLLEANIRRVVGGDHGLG